MIRTSAFVVAVASITLAESHAAHAGAPNPLAFDMVFEPDVIGPGSVSTLRFTIRNETPAPATDVRFVNMLPANVTVATPSRVTTTCTDGVVTADDGGGSIELTNGRLGAGASCLVTVSVSSAMPGPHTNTTQPLQSSLGTSNAATDDLTVDTNRLGFSKSFAPSVIPWRGISRLTFVLDNSLGPSNHANVQGIDILDGAVVADPPNVATDCQAAQLDVTAGATEIAIASGAGLLFAGATCSLSLDVVGTSVGRVENLTQELTSIAFGSFFTVSAGKATDVLDVRRDSHLHLTAEFVDDPVPPGGQVTVRYTIWNSDRGGSATNVAFSHDFGAALAGLAAVGLPVTDVCGVGSSVAGTNVLTFSGGTVAAESSCSFDVTLAVPAAANGSYSIATSAITGDFATSTTGNVATPQLSVASIPIVTQVITPVPAAAGTRLSIEYTIANTDAANAATDIAFVNPLSDNFPGVPDVVLPANGFCGAGASIQLSSPSIEEWQLNMIGGSLDPAASCTFTVEVTIPDMVSNGVYANVTEPVTATVAGAAVIGSRSTASYTVVAAPTLQKSFQTSPVVPGDTVVVEYTFTLGENAPTDVTSLSFTDDLDGVVTGLVATGLPQADVCGAGSQLAGDTVVTLTGGTLAPGTSCSFTVSVVVPAATPQGSYVSTTSDVTGMVQGTAVTGVAGQATLVVSSLGFRASFIPDTVRPGVTTVLEFEIENTGTQDATGMFFTTNLSEVIPGLMATALPAEPCGAGSSISGTTFLIFVSGTLAPGSLCTFQATVQVPAGAAVGDYRSVTSMLTATVGGVVSQTRPAVSPLFVADPVMISKSFVGPAMPGGTATLEFTLSNGDAADTATAVGFSDDLDAMLSGAEAVGLPMSDVCGAGSTLSGTGVITLAGGTLGPQTSCNFSVTVQLPPVVNSFSATNITSQVSADLGGVVFIGNSAEARLDIQSIRVTKAFSASVLRGDTVTLSYTVDNLNAVGDAREISFVDDVDAALTGLVATTLPANGFCGADAQISGSTAIAVRGASLAGGASCSFDVELTVPTSAVPGDYLSTTSGVTQNGIAAGAPAVATLTVIPAIPTFTKVFSPSPTWLAVPSTLTFTIDNTANIVGIDQLVLNDTLPAGLVVATPSNAGTTCTAGTLTAADGASVITYTDGSVAASATCVVTVDVIASAPGDYDNTASLSSSVGASGPATSSLHVPSVPGLTKRFSRDTVFLDGVVTVTLTIDNTANIVDVGDLMLSDVLPAGLEVAASPDATTTCTGGTLTATAGSTTVTYQGGTVAAGSGCIVSFAVTASASGSHTNTATLESQAGISGNATAMLLVPGIPMLSATFAPGTIRLLETSTLTLDIDNTANVVDLQFRLSDVLPDGLAVANPAEVQSTCSGGELTAAAGERSVTLFGSTVAAGARCAVEVLIAPTAAGSHDSTASLVATAGVAEDAVATLVVLPAPSLQVSYDVAEVNVEATATLTFTIDNSANADEVSALAFTSELPRGLLVADVAGVQTTCSGGNVEAAAGQRAISLAAGSVAAGGTCTVQVTIVAKRPGTFSHVTTLASSAGASDAVEAEITVLLVEVSGEGGCSSASHGSPLVLFVVMLLVMGRRARRCLRSVMYGFVLSLAACGVEAPQPEATSATGLDQAAVPQTSYAGQIDRDGTGVAENVGERPTVLVPRHHRAPDEDNVLKGDPKGPASFPASETRRAK